MSQPLPHDKMKDDRKVDIEDILITPADSNVG